MLYGGQIHSKRASSPLLFVESEDDVRAVYERFEQEFSEAFSPLAVNVPGGVYIDTFVLRVAVPGQKLELPELELTTSEADARRHAPGVLRRAGSTRRSTSSRRCSPATRLAGPAIVQAALHDRGDPAGPAVLDRDARARNPGGATDDGRSPPHDQKLDMIRLAEPTEDELRAVAALAPGDYEIGFQRTNDILDEALEVFQRSSRSSMGIAGDVMIALFTRQRRPRQRGRRHVPARDHPADPDQVHPRALQREPGRSSDGDIWFANDALYGGIHNPDQVIVLPIFHDGKLIAWAGAANHTTETGAVEPGGMPVSATTRFHEGLNLPPIKIGAEPPAARRHARAVQRVRHPRAADDHHRPEGARDGGRPGAHAHPRGRRPRGRGLRRRRAAADAAGGRGGRAQADRLVAGRQVPLRELRRRARHRARAGAHRVA